jgi:hypothetical protein
VNKSGEFYGWARCVLRRFLFLSSPTRSHTH